MQLFGAPLSPFVRKTRIVAALKGLEYDHDKRPSPLGWPDGFENINPIMRIPALLPDPSNPDFAINDSSAICAYFEKLQPQPSVYPTEAEAHGRALWIEELADTEVANRIGMGVFRPVFFNLAAGKPADIDAAQDGFEKLASGLLAYLDNQLGAAEWFAGDMFSIADIAVTTQLMNLNMVGFAVPAARFERLRAHYERCLAQASIAQFADEDAAFLSKSGMVVERIID